ncbi:DnaJ domain-containing protein [Tolypothrix sp. FACHB-123]|uniref:J domain-containing protein n=1 Tax=Tolypothrix sp. FACHB-123 TaxID=2692868 RepID=UPI0016855D4B|nr:DnaJ domain-containing protein [Tolypothrix sp. FACHB-123]MBD2354221.1 DnaJ domain-containing protein [Tolypothrix sp. FACHB-123]
MSNDQPRSRFQLNINDSYAILGLKPGASQAQVKQAYRNLIKTWHPDRFGDPEEKQIAEEKIKKINVAYNHLKSQQLPTNPQPRSPSSAKNPPKVSVNTWNAETFYNLGVQNASQGRYQDAIADFTRAIRLNPRYIDAYKYRGLVCSQLGYEHRATSDLNKAAQLEQDFNGGKTSFTYSSAKWSTSSRTASTSQPLVKRWCQKIKTWFYLNLSWR